MAKTKFQRELEKRSQGELVRMCEGKGLDHTGDKSQLVARLVEWEKSQPEPEVELPAEEPPEEELPAEEPPDEE